MSQTPDDQLKALWLGQEPETPTMTVQAIRLLVKDQQARQRHYRTFALAVAVFATGVWIWCAWTAPTPLVRVGDLVMLGWLPVTLWMVYQRRPGRAPGPEMSAQGLIEFYRAEVLRQRPNLRLIGLSLAPLLVGMALIGSEVIKKLMRKPDLWVQAWPLAALIVLWAVLFVLQIRRQRRRIAERLRDIDALRG